MTNPHHRPKSIRPLLGASALALVALLSPLAVSAQTAPAAAATPAPAQADERTVWDLTPIFADQAAWDAARKQALADLPSLEALQGTLGKDAASLRAALDRLSEVGRTVEKVSVYAYLQYSTDTRNEGFQERLNLSQALGSQAQAATAWLAPEVQAHRRGQDRRLHQG